MRYGYLVYHPHQQVQVPDVYIASILGTGIKFSLSSTIFNMLLLIGFRLFTPRVFLFSILFTSEKVSSKYTEVCCNKQRVNSWLHYTLASLPFVSQSSFFVPGKGLSVNKCNTVYVYARIYTV